MAVVVPLSDDRRRVDAAIDRLQALVQADMERVNTTIVDRMGSSVPMIPQLAGYLVRSGGKRLRPMLTLAAAQMCGYEGDGHTKLAAAVEFIHTATLLHDDVVDESDLRRGQPTANIVFGNQASVLVGDFLFSRAFQLMVETDSLKVLEILSNASAVIAEGEVMQLAAAHDVTTTEDTYLQVIASKTAALFSAAARVGAVVAGRPSPEEVALDSFGRNLGIAFQIVDDALDYSGVQEDLGKAVGDDFRDGKITLPVVLAYRRGDETERAFWKRCLEDGDVTQADLSHAIDLIRRHNALADTIDRAHHYGRIARDALAIFPANTHRQALLDVVDFAIARAH
ncbi:MAG: polyprenyl synthetase family protein [Alphaproteobacteria bacterium]